MSADPYSHAALPGRLPGQLFVDDELSCVPAGSTVPVLHPDRARRGDDVEIKVTTDPGASQDVAMPTLRRTTSRPRPAWHVPFTGSPDYFFVRLPALIDPGLRATQGEIDGDELVLTYRGADDDPDVQRRDIEGQVAAVRRCLDHLRTAARQ